jgi:glycosyltransferase involved in cell wall biosynthesis
MASCDLFVFPRDASRADEVLDAQASGLPALVADHGAAGENLLDRVTGYLCRCGSERAFCCRTAELLIDGARRGQMAEAARAFAGNRTWTTGLRPLFDGYREVMAPAAPAGPARIIPPSSRWMRRSTVRAS